MSGRVARRNWSGTAALGAAGCGRRRVGSGWVAWPRKRDAGESLARTSGAIDWLSRGLEDPRPSRGHRLHITATHAFHRPTGRPIPRSCPTPSPTIPAFYTDSPSIPAALSLPLYTTLGSAAESPPSWSGAIGTETTGSTYRGAGVLLPTSTL